MKKLFVLVLAALVFASCQSLPEKFEAFVSDVEANYESYSELEWNAVNQKYEEFKMEFVKKYDKLNSAEIEYMNKAFGRYDAVIVKAKIKDVADGVKRFFGKAGDYIEGLVDGIAKDSTSVK